MNEGVVLWGPGRRTSSKRTPRHSNCGVTCRRFGNRRRHAHPDDGTHDTQHQRGRRELSVDVTEVGSGLLAIIRDITAERTLERRRREMQRLVSHELKTPLASIAGFGETLERYQLSGDELSRVASMIRGEAGRLQEMVTCLPRPRTARRRPLGRRERAGGSRRAGQSTSRRSRGGRRSRAARPSSSIDRRPAADRRRAGPARPGGRQSCRQRHQILRDRVTDIEVAVRRDGDRVILTVSDHGPGIPEESLRRIFDRFYRVPGTEGSGAGLGLALVKEVVDWHGGCMDNRQ